MMRNLLVLGCAGLLALGLSISTFAGVDPDTDGDGITDSNDNCVTIPNGPLGGVCASNQDGLAAEDPGFSPDGYGTACDSDFNNNGATDAVDLSTMITAVSNVSGDVDTDLNCNLAADAVDLSTVIADTIAVKVPGPSGKACQGSVPCP